LNASAGVNTCGICGRDFLVIETQFGAPYKYDLLVKHVIFLSSFPQLIISKLADGLWSYTIKSRSLDLRGLCRRGNRRGRSEDREGGCKSVKTRFTESMLLIVDVS
jgi:hypothetical protein